MGYFVLVVSVLIEICLGGVYAWSAFVPPLVSQYGLSTTQTQVIFGATFCVFTGLMVLAGRLQDIYGPRPVAAAGGLLFGAGYLVSSYSGGSFAMLLLGYGVLGGAGIGFTYVCPLATCVKWFPHRKGLAAGTVVAGYGAGAIVLSALASALFARGLDVLEVFRFVGIAYGGIVTLGALLLFTPNRICIHSLDRRYPVADLLRDRSFRGLALGMFCGTFAGMMIVGNIKPIGLSFGVGAAAATLAISTFAIGNATGRISWGYISDRLGHRVIPLSLLISTFAVAALLPAAGSPAAFVVVSAIVAFGFGANFVIYAAEVASRYGADAVGSVYPIVLLFYGVSGIAGPAVGGWLFDSTGSYAASIIAAAAVTAAGILITSLLIRAEAERPPEAVDPGWLEEQEYMEMGGG